MTWDARSADSSEQFEVTKVDPSSLAPPNPKVFYFGPYDKLRYVAVASSHSADGGQTFEANTAKYQEVCLLAEPSTYLVGKFDVSDNLA